MSIINPNFMCFSDREKILDEFNKYCEENNIPKSNFNLITFLQTNNLLNESNIIEFTRTYKCDIEKNIECKKNNCYINDGPCTRTTDITKSLNI